MPSSTAKHDSKLVISFFIASPHWLRKAHGAPLVLINISHPQPGDLGVLRGDIHFFSEEARTRGFASLVLASYAFVSATVHLKWDSVERNANDSDF